MSDCKDPTWEVAANGDRTCAACGSWHPDEFRKFLTTVDGTTRYVEMADGGIKIYVTQPGVRSYRDGAIKFYLRHIPVADRDQVSGELLQALMLCNKGLGKLKSPVFIGEFN